MNLISLSENYTTQGEYVIFEYESIDMWLSFEGVEEGHKSYTCIDLQVIDKPAIILHKMYIQTMLIDSRLKKNLSFVPTNFLVFHFRSNFGN